MKCSPYWAKASSAEWCSKVRREDAQVWMHNRLFASWAISCSAWRSEVRMDSYVAGCRCTCGCIVDVLEDGLVGLWFFVLSDREVSRARESMRVVVSGALNSGFLRVGSIVDGRHTSGLGSLDSLVALALEGAWPSDRLSTTSPRHIPAYPWLLAVKVTICTPR